MGLPEIGQQRRQAGDREGTQRAQAEAAFGNAMAKLGAGQVAFRHDHPGAVEEAAAGSRQGGAPAAFKEPRAQVQLKLGDAGRQGRLGDVHTFGGAGEIARLADRQEIADLVEIHL